MALWQVTFLPLLLVFAEVEPCLIYKDELMWDCMKIYFQYSLKKKKIIKISQYGVPW